MRQLSFASRTARLALAFLLAIVMCAPVSAHAEESAEGASGSAAAGQVNSQVDQASSSEDAGVSSGQVADAADGVDAGEANAASGAASGEEDSSAQALASAPVAAGAVTMQQGAGEAKEYDSLAAALADAADYDYKTNKDTYVITLNENVSESVVVDGKKRVTIDLNGKTLSPVSAGGVALMVSSTQTVTVKDTVGGGEIVGDGAVAVRVGDAGKLAVAGAAVKAGVSSSAIFNQGTLTVTGGSVTSQNGTYPAIVNEKTMTISDGSVEGSDVAVSNLGTLTVKGGSVSNANTGADACAIYAQGSGKVTVSNGEITSPSTAVSACHSASVMVTGGAVSGGECGVRAAESATVAISGGSLASSGGYALSASDSAAATISSGEFTSAAGKKAIDRTSTAAVTLSGGVFGVASVADVCDSPTFVDRYGAVEKDGRVVVEMIRPAAVVVNEDDTQTAYDTFTKACSNAPAYSTVKLMEDAVLGKYSAEVKQFGVTVDLNGFSIDGAAYTGSNAALTLGTKYGAKPVDGKDSTLRLINSKPEAGGKVTAKLPVAGKSGDSSLEVPVLIGEEVELAVANGGADKVKLASSAYLVYTEKTSSFFSNGGFKVNAADGTQRVYGVYSSAAKYAAEGSTVTMLNDFTGDETIYSGNKVATLDLGEHTYTYTGTQQVLYINYDNAGIVLKNGTVVATQTLSQAGVAMLYNNGTLAMDHVVMNVAGDSWGIGANGTNVGNTIVLRDSTLNVPEGLGIYFPSTGSVTIDNSVINAKHFGIQVCAGSLTVTGDETVVTATGAPQAKTDGDGPIIDGAAISVVEREGYQDLDAVAIEGGTFKASDASKAVKAYTFNNADRVEGEWPDAGSVVAVSGGSFSDPVDEGICADGFAPQQNADGSFGVHEHQFTISHSDADSHWAECAICGAVSGKQAHSFTVVQHDGENHWMKCEGCDAVSAKTAHAFTVVEHDGEGHWTKCEVCGMTTEKTPHVSDAWSFDAEGHWGTCSECGATVDKTAHSFEWVIDKEATEAEPGSKHEQCTTCGFGKEPVVIPATGAGDSADASGADRSAALARTGDSSAILIGSLALASIAAAALLLLARRRVIG